MKSADIEKPLWHDDPHHFIPGERVEVFSFGRWYQGTVERIGRTCVITRYVTGTEHERVKNFSPSKVRPLKTNAVTFGGQNVSG